MAEEHFLEQRGAGFVIRDVASDPHALEEIASRGYMSTPVIKVGDRWIAGFKKKQLEQALGQLAEKGRGA